MPKLASPHVSLDEKCTSEALYVRSYCSARQLDDAKTKSYVDHVATICELSVIE